MHIRITQLDARPEDAMAELAHQRGLVAAYVMRSMDEPQPFLATVWAAVEYADLSPVTVGGQDYIEGRFVGTDSGDVRAAYASIIYFDGPRPQAEADAIERANRERIEPAVRGLPGTLGAFVGRNPDGSFVVLALTTSLQAIEDAQRAVMSTELLPGEDPAHLAGPTRIQLAWVLATASHDTPITA